MAEIVRLVRADRIVVNELIQTTEGWTPVQAVYQGDTEDSQRYGRSKYPWLVFVIVEDSSSSTGRRQHSFSNDDLITSRGINGFTQGEEVR